MLFNCFASKNQLPGLSVSGTLVENELKKRKEKKIMRFKKYFEYLDQNDNQLGIIEVTENIAFTRIIYFFCS